MCTLFNAFFFLYYDFYSLVSVAVSRFFESLVEFLANLVGTSGIFS